MKYRTLLVAKSLKLDRPTADWLARISAQRREPEAVIVRQALRAMRENSADTPREGEI
jgi:hypothetical protein